MRNGTSPAVFVIQWKLLSQRYGEWEPFPTADGMPSGESEKRLQGAHLSREGSTEP